MYFFGLKIYTLGIFLGQEIGHIFFQVLKKYVYFFDVDLRETMARHLQAKSVLTYLSLYFFGQDILMRGIFLGLKLQAHVFLRVCNMKLCRTPPSCILQVPVPPPGDMSVNKYERQSSRVIGTLVQDQHQYLNMQFEFAFNYQPQYG